MLKPSLQQTLPQPAAFNGRPQLSPRPQPQSVQQCQVVVIGGSLGGVAAAAQAMQSGATTCLIELTPWLGGQISSQGVSALDESLQMRDRQNYSPSWASFRQRIAQQPLTLPSWVPVDSPVSVADINACWVGTLCFPPMAGATASAELLQQAAQNAPQSLWLTATAFKGAEFDAAGQNISAVYAVQRKPRQVDYVPAGRLSEEISDWYSWSPSATFEKKAVRLQPPPGESLIVIDATDTGELVGWADIPHRLGSEARETTGEINGSDRNNPQCTQALTYPFAIALHDDSGQSLAQLSQVESTYEAAEHIANFALENFPVFAGRSLFHYRRIVSTTRNNPYTGLPALGDITMINWNRGNDWNWMNPPLILTDAELDASGQRQNWLGGISALSLKHAEDRALLFAKWLLETQATPEFPLTYLAGAATPMGTQTGLSMTPYIREGRRILGRAAYGQSALMLREADLRKDQPGGRDFQASAVGLVHYDIDIHGCRYRNWEPSGEATAAPAREFVVRPTQIPLEALIPQGVENVLIGGKAIAVTHIVNAVTRIHYSEWSTGAAAGATAAWLVTQAEPGLTPAKIVESGNMPELQAHLRQQGLSWSW
ncbi:MAG: FAD-dependent oxidoreductase [Leptolyngbyaceae cyanobacterium SM1_1_3]|nr:FAD-dependent oxidoreductase [Leptolyngbyaceae cyanobacterium SM1_1_3]NJN03933.1 FAD-dependent oxidoreductase [Leptolyngbyaceae cyanobacterium RM1_1_2]NJO11749.1 FAD-dependent oxidoreductase [Leptolyngbyaceae cyanobacterium SL_1_1]